MSARPIRLTTRIWLTACLVTLALALVPVLIPSASSHGCYGTPHSNRLQRHSFLNVAERRPDARLSRGAHQPPPSALLGLSGPALNPRPWSRPICIPAPLLSVQHHHRQLGRATPSDPALFVSIASSA